MALWANIKEFITFLTSLSFSAGNHSERISDVKARVHLALSSLTFSSTLCVFAHSTLYIKTHNPNDLL